MNNPTELTYGDRYQTRLLASQLVAAKGDMTQIGIVSEALDFYCQYMGPDKKTLIVNAYKAAVCDKLRDTEEYKEDKEAIDIKMKTKKDK